MKRDITDKKFDGFSKEKQKQYIAELLIRTSGSTPIEPPEQPVAIVMAGLPGAGKTEFLDTLSELLSKTGFRPFVRIDLDQIVTVFPSYTPQRYNKFRSQGNYALARCVDVAREQRYNMMVDGTFSGSTDAPIRNIEKLLDAGYKVEMYYMYDDALTAWRYTVDRELETKRGIGWDGFVRACENIPVNLGKVTKQFHSHKNFILSVVLQKKLRDKEYRIVRDNKGIDRIIKEGYNIDSIRKSL